MQACLRRKNYRAVRCSHSLRRICRQRCDLQYVWYRTLLLAPDMIYKSLERIVARRNLRVAKWLGIYPGRRSLYLVQSRIQGSSERHKESGGFPGESQAPIRCSQMQERGSIGDSPQANDQSGPEARGLKARLWKASYFPSSGL